MRSASTPVERGSILQREGENYVLPRTGPEQGRPPANPPHLLISGYMHWRRKWQPTPVFLPGESQGWGSLVGCHLWGRTESDTTGATQQQQQQEEEMATHSSVLAWRIPGTGEPGGLPSMGSQSRTRLKRLSSSSTCTYDILKCS